MDSSRTDDQAEANVSPDFIRTIMASSDQDALNITDGALQIICTATEMFVQLLARQGHKKAKSDAMNVVSSNMMVDYKHLAEYVQGESGLQFLHKFVPKKITVAEYRAIMLAEAAMMSTSEDEEGDI